jgi:SpoVK/Ycf46/Vps4 family AAA+-type ATPase
LDWQILSSDAASSDISPENIDSLADRTERFSGSDLHELCRAAAFGPVRDAIDDERLATADGSQVRAGGKPRTRKLRKLAMADFVAVLDNEPTTQQQAKKC